MKLSRWVLVNLATLLGLAFIAWPSRAQDLGDMVSQPGVFSYQAPKGWAVRDTPVSKYKVCVDAPKNKFAANINVVTESYSDTLAKYVEINKAALKATPMFKNLQFVDEKPFATATGINGVRIVATDTLSDFDLQQIFYFFDGAPGTKFVVTASCLASDGAAYAPIFDASLKTFSTQ